jgi:hypothetical protein
LKFKFVLDIDVKNDRLTRDAGRIDLEIMLLDMISRSVHELPWIIRTEAKEISMCEHKTLAFEGYIGAPGYGQAWKCSECGEALWSPGGAVNAVPYSELERPPELSIEDVR